jgi:hypothetical protein
MKDERERLTLLLKHVHASSDYVTYFFRQDSPKFLSFLPLGDYVGDHVDMDHLDLSRYSTLSEFCDSKGFDLPAATGFTVVTRDTINGGQVNPHFVVLL